MALIKNLKNNAKIEGSNKMNTKKKVDRKARVLVLCTGNSCRSQMAEAYLKRFGINAQSAGIEAHGLNRRAILIMQEDRLDISENTSTRVNHSMFNWADIVLTVCGDADDNCPVLSAKTKKIHIPYRDPAQATGTEKEIMDIFRRVRDEIGEDMKYFSTLLDSGDVVSLEIQSIQRNISKHLLLSQTSYGGEVTSGAINS